MACVTTNLLGGLGNQLFLIANLLAVSRRNRIPAALPRVRCVPSVENARPSYWESVFPSLSDLGVASTIPMQLPEVLVPEPRPVAPIHLDPSRPCVYRMIGFFQSAQFFADAPIIRTVIPPTQRASASHRLCQHYANADPSLHLIGLHVRRGDYLRLPDMFEVMPISYYETAVRQLMGRAVLTPGRSRLVLFAEDTADAAEVAEHMRRVFPNLRPVAVCAACEGDTCGGEKCPREVTELLMLAACADVVMANSSWSWWAAYLNEQPMRRVVAPVKWFVKEPFPMSRHLYDENWILL